MRITDEQRDELLERFVQLVPRLILSMISLGFIYGGWLATQTLSNSAQDMKIAAMQMELDKRGEWMKAQTDATSRIEERQKAVIDAITRIERKVDK